MPIINIACPICHNTEDCHDRDDLIVDCTVVHDTQGEPPYTAPITTVEDVGIDWQSAGHTDCERIYDWLTSFIYAPVQSMSQSTQASRDAARKYLDAFDDAIAKLALEADAEGSYYGD